MRWEEFGFLKSELYHRLAIILSTDDRERLNDHARRATAPKLKYSPD
jgi:hypothetical protein